MSDPDFSDTSSGLISRRRFLASAAGFACAITLPVKALCASESFEPFSFAFVNDVHLASNLPDTYRLVHESQLFLQDVVKQLNQIDLDFIIFGGDQIETVGKDESNWQLFLDITQALAQPWSFVLGESDVSDVPGEFPIDKMKTFGRDWQGRGITCTRPYWSHDPLPGVHLIGLDTSEPNTSIGDVSPRQLDWLRKDLSDHGHKFIMVFSHHPLLPPLDFSGPSWGGFVLPQASAVREILGSCPGVKLAVSGHIPVSKIQQERSIWYVSSPGIAVFPCSYRIFHVSPSTITMETHSVGFPALIKKARKALIDSTVAYHYNRDRPEKFIEIAQGNALDRNCRLPLMAGARPAPYSPMKRKGAGKRTNRGQGDGSKRPALGGEDNERSPGKAAPESKGKQEPPTAKGEGVSLERLTPGPMPGLSDNRLSPGDPAGN